LSILGALVSDAAAPVGASTVSGTCLFASLRLPSIRLTTVTGREDALADTMVRTVAAKPFKFLLHIWVLSLDCG